MVYISTTLSGRARIIKEFVWMIWVGKQVLRYCWNKLCTTLLYKVGLLRITNLIVVMESLTKVQILKKAICISLCTNVCKKGMNLFIPLLVSILGKRKLSIQINFVLFNWLFVLLFCWWKRGWLNTFSDDFSLM